MIKVTHPYEVLRPQDIPFNSYFFAEHSIYGAGLFLCNGDKVIRRTIIKVDDPIKFWDNPNENSGFSRIRLVKDVNISYNF